MSRLEISGTAHYATSSGSKNQKCPGDEAQYDDADGGRSLCPTRLFYSISSYLYSQLIGRIYSKIHLKSIKMKEQIFFEEVFFETDD